MTEQDKERYERIVEVRYSRPAWVDTTQWRKLILPGCLWDYQRIYRHSNMVE